MTKRKNVTGQIQNRRARYDYEIFKNYEAGIVLNGAEVKSLRTGHGHLRGSFVTVKDGELWLNNATITPTVANQKALEESEQTRPRKLLVNAKELKELSGAKDQGLTIIPLRIFTKKRFIKIEIATAKGLKKYDKRERIKQREVNRNIDNILRT